MSTSEGGEETAKIKKMNFFLKNKFFLLKKGIRVFPDRAMHSR